MKREISFQEGEISPDGRNDINEVISYATVEERNLFYDGEISPVGRNDINDCHFERNAMKREISFQEEKISPAGRNDTKRSRSSRNDIKRN